MFSLRFPKGAAGRKNYSKNVAGGPHRVGSENVLGKKMSLQSLRIVIQAWRHFRREVCRIGAVGGKVSRGGGGRS